MHRSVACATRSWIALVGFLACSAAFSGTVPTRLEFIGEALLPPGLQVEDRSVGGLSGIAYEPKSGRYYVVSDEPSKRFPASFFVLEIDLKEGRLGEGAVRVTDAVTLQDESGLPFKTNGVDPEGAAFTAAGNLLVSSEGQAAAGIPPFIREFEVNGQPVRTFVLPDRYLPSQSRGVRHNLGFEALTVTPDSRYAIVATENALTQDGPKSTLETRSPSRIARFDTLSASLVDEYLYWVEPVAKPAAVVGGLEVAGLVELIALDETHLLSLERSFSVGAGNSIRLFLVSLAGATDISNRDSLAAVDLDTIRPVSKQLLVDFSDLGVTLDNVEGMCFGPRLADGRRSLVMVGDDNFNYPAQVSQLLAFAVSTESTRISQIQGAGHFSPLEGQWVGQISGVVTALQGGKEAGFWMQGSADGSKSPSSSAIQVLASHAGEVTVGDRVEVWGRVVEADNRYGLTVTTLEASSFGVLEIDVDLPPAVRVGKGGRRPPDSVLDDDGLRWFEPDFDGIDFWESLEGMRVELGPATVVGPTSRHGDVVVVADSEVGASDRTAVDGVLLRPGDENPERLTVDTYRLGEVPSAAVGDRLEGNLVGILDYRFGTFRLLAMQTFPRSVARPRAAPGGSALKGGKASLTIATYNVENLAPSDDVERLRRLARSIVDQLGGPDILALQEVQDNSGAEDDGVVEADKTFEGLIQAISEAGGPAYEYSQIDPEDGADGGRPGANIRVGYLFDPERVELRSRGSEAPASPATTARVGEGGAELSVSPGLVRPEHPAFRGDETRGFEPGRKSLAVEFQFRGKTLFVVNNHLKSKRGDDPLFGPRQPRVLATEDQRSQQTAVIGALAGELSILDPTARVIVLGDLNDHEFRSPLRVLEGAGLVNLMYSVPAAERY
jgi:endonuclease/exonuclease/phosphatase family metal-dependent hydrolase